jgi:hypothetical protein
MLNAQGERARQSLCRDFGAQNIRIYAHFNQLFFDESRQPGVGLSPRTALSVFSLASLRNNFVPV